ncbi:unnamed protein product [Miscanthus lutarioriparius]|uniref:Uncharacterized protein n=1 Tax=Miscanthus lutarioriparius TaxID=422564 RepID=A0A811PH10_9POAL|nr:unnamed protein product [Miscanthus lutarioriparius]
MAEAGAPAVLIRPEHADKAQGKNVIIDEPRVAPNVIKNLGRKVVLEKDDEGKNKLKINVVFEKAAVRLEIGTWKTNEKKI